MAAILQAPLNKAQLEILRFLSRPISDTDLKAIKKMLVRYFADRMTEEADQIWEKNGWTDEDAHQMIQGHLRSATSKK